MADPARRYRKRLLGTLTAKEIKEGLTSTDFLDELQSMIPEKYGGPEGQARAEYEFLHWFSIFSLRKAEEYLCPERVSALISLSEILDADALPQDFFQRIVVLHKKIKDAGRRRRRKLERDSNIRDMWHLLMETSSSRMELNLYRQALGADDNFLANIDPKPSHEDALKILADEFGCSEKTIEAVIYGNDGLNVDHSPSDFFRLQAALAKRFDPEKSMATSR